MTDESILIGESLRRMADEKPMHSTPPLLVGVERDNDAEDVLDEITGQFHLHECSDPRVITAIAIGGVIVRCRDVDALLSIDGVSTVECDGYMSVDV